MAVTSVTITSGPTVVGRSVTLSGTLARDGGGTNNSFYFLCYDSTFTNSFTVRRLSDNSNLYDGSGTAGSGIAWTWTGTLPEGSYLGITAYRSVTDVVLSSSTASVGTIKLTPGLPGIWTPRRDARGLFVPKSPTYPTVYGYGDRAWSKSQGFFYAIPDGVYRSTTNAITKTGTYGNAARGVPTQWGLGIDAPAGWEWNGGGPAIYSVNSGTQVLVSVFSIHNGSTYVDPSLYPAVLGESRTTGNFNPASDGGNYAFWRNANGEQSLYTTISPAFGGGVISINGIGNGLHCLVLSVTVGGGASGFKVFLNGKLVATSAAPTYSSFLMVRPYYFWASVSQSGLNIGNVLLNAEVLDVSLSDQSLAALSLDPYRYFFVDAPNQRQTLTKRFYSLPTIAPVTRVSFDDLLAADSVSTYKSRTSAPFSTQAGDAIIVFAQAGDANGTASLTATHSDKSANTPLTGLTPVLSDRLTSRCFYRIVPTGQDNDSVTVNWAGTAGNAGGRWLAVKVLVYRPGVGYALSFDSEHTGFTDFGAGSVPTVSSQFTTKGMGAIISFLSSDYITGDYSIPAPSGFSLLGTAFGATRAAEKFASAAASGQTVSWVGDSNYYRRAVTGLALFATSFQYARPTTDVLTGWSRTPASGTHASAINEVSSNQSDLLSANSVGQIDSFTMGQLQQPATGGLDINYDIDASVRSTKIELLNGVSVVKSVVVSGSLSAGRFLPQRWRRQPQGAVQIDWNNPLCNGLMFAQVGNNPFDLVSRSTGTVNGTYSNTYSTHGAGFNLALTGYINYPVLPQFMPSNNAVSVMNIARPNNGLPNNSGGRFFGRSASGGGLFGIGFSISPYGSNYIDFGIRNEQGVGYGGQIYVSEYTVYNDPLVLSASGATNVPIKMYSKGILQSTGATLNNNFYGAGLGGYSIGSSDGSSAAANGLTFMNAVWNRVKSDAEEYEIGGNPWQIFRPATPKLFSLPGATTGTINVSSAELAGVSWPWTPTVRLTSQ